MCKNIMNRLSTSRDIEFKGKIQSVLSSVLPLTHKSGLNISGRFNVQKNNTGIEQVEGASPEEYKLYKNFWSLQKVLAHPHQLFQQNTTIDLEDLDDEIISEEYEDELAKRESQEESGAIPDDDFIEPESGQILETSQEVSIKKAVAKMKDGPSNLLKVLV
jgi:hypothetical protein